MLTASALTSASSALPRAISSAIGPLWVRPQSSPCSIGRRAITLTGRTSPRIARSSNSAACHALVHIDVRVGAKGNQCIGIVRHVAGHVGVQVERDYDRGAGPELLPQPCQQFALGVLLGLGDHRAVQVQQGTVNGTFPVCGLENHADDLFEVPRGVVRITG